MPRSLPSAGKTKWIKGRQLDLPLIKPAIPAVIKAALKEEIKFKEGDLAIVTDNQGDTTLARYHDNAGGRSLEELHIDTAGYPHQTGTTRAVANVSLTPVAVWTHLNKHYQQPCDRKSCHRSRHVDRRYFKVREMAFEGCVKVEHIDTKLNSSDLLTKPLPLPVFEMHKRRLMGMG